MILKPSYNTLTAANGNTALDLIKQYPVDLVTLDLKKAKEELLKIIVDNGDSKKVYSSLLNILFKENAISEAKETIFPSLKLDPGFSDAHNNLGQIYFREKKLKEAEKEFLMALNEKQRPLKNAKFCFSSRKAKILTTGIHLVFRGLKFEPDAGIGQKGVFFKGIKQCSPDIYSGHGSN